MKSNYPIVPLERTDLLKLIPLMTLTKLAKIALKSGTTPTTFVEAAVEAGYTGAGGHHALRSAGHRTRKLRKDRGVSLRMKLNKLIGEAKELQDKLAQQGSSPSSE